MDPRLEETKEKAGRRLRQPGGMPAFLIIWFGQLVSLVGTGMTQFALTIWAWQITGQATALALVGFFNIAPTVLLSPIAGALVDRWNRKLTMMISDLLAGIAAFGVLILLSNDQLQLWHLFVAGLLAGTGQAFQWPAYSASISLMLNKDQYARASGLLSIAEGASGILAPLLGGAVLAIVGLAGVLTIDLLTFGIAVVTLLIVYIPQPRRSEAGEEGQGSLVQESLYGFRYIFARPSLFGLQLIFTAINLLATMIFILVAPLVLARTNQDAIILATTLSAGAVGGVIGGVLLGIWGGPKRKIHGVLISMAMASFSAGILFGIGQTVFIWSLAMFLSSFFFTIVNGSNQAIWQAKVEPDVQGRVFATRRLIAQISTPVAMLIAGPLADNIFEPALMPGGELAGSLSWLVGSGAGAGMSLIIVMAGIIGVLSSLSGYLIEPIRDVEEIIPDHYAAAEPAAA